MKSITNQYKDLKEGKMSQANFMRNIRMTFPHLVTNVTSFDDSIKILKNKGLLYEEKTKAKDVSPKQIKIGTKVEKEHTKSAKKAKKIAMDHLTKEDPEYYTKLKKAGLEEAENETTKPAYGYKNYTELSNAIDKAIDSGKISPEELEAASKKAETDSTELALLLVKAFLAEAKGSSGKEQYADFNEVDNLNAQEVLIGIDCEMQMNLELSKEEATKIAIKNIKKDPNYYTNYTLAGKEAKAEYISKFKEGSDQMKPVNGEDSLVDKDNGMKSPKDIEKVKASAAKANKETNKVVKGVQEMTHNTKTVRGVKRMDPTGGKMKKINVKETLKNSIKKLIAEILQEENEPNLTSEEEKVVQDILQTYRNEKNSKQLEENTFSDTLNKVKDYAKKGLMTAAVSSILASCAPEINYYPTTGRGTSYGKQKMTRSQKACPGKWMQDRYGSSNIRTVRKK